MKTITNKEHKLVFSAEIDQGIANAIRRYVYHIPVVAIDEVEISKNDSALYDEMVGHRVGLIPLKTKKQKGEVTLKAKKSGIVYSQELTGDAEAVYGKIPIVLLNEGQEFELKGFLKAGRGTEHAKFSPGNMFFRTETEISMDKSFKENIQKIFPNIEIGEKAGKIILKDNQEKEISDVCEGIVEKSGKKVEMEEKNNLIISLESFGQISPGEIFKKSIEELKSDLEEISKKLK